MFNRPSNAVAKSRRFSLHVLSSSLPHKVMNPLHNHIAGTLQLLRSAVRKSKLFKGNRCSEVDINSSKQAPFLIFRRYADRHDRALCLICEECHPVLARVRFPLLLPWSPSGKIPKTSPRFSICSEVFYRGYILLSALNRKAAQLANQPSEQPVFKQFGLAI